MRRIRSRAGFRATSQWVPARVWPPRPRITPEDRRLEAPRVGSPSPGEKPTISKTASFEGVFGIPARGTIFKGAAEAEIARLRFVRQDVAIADVERRSQVYQKLPRRVPIGADEVLRFKLLLVLMRS